MSPDSTSKVDTRNAKSILARQPEPVLSLASSIMLFSGMAWLAVSATVSGLLLLIVEAM